VHATEQQRPDVASARHHWKTALQHKLDPKKLVFLDETGTATNMARARGRRRRGVRLIRPRAAWSLENHHPPHLRRALP
jgi:hypothetical protein